MDEQALEITQSNLFDSIVLHVATVLFIGTVLLATLQISIRQMNSVLFDLFEFTLPSLHWTEPTARFTLIVMTYIGAAVAARNHEHIAISILLDKIGDRWPLFHTVVTLLVVVLCTVFLLIVLRGSAFAAFNEWHTNLGAVSYISAGVIYLGMSLGVGIAAYYYGVRSVTKGREMVQSIGQYRNKHVVRKEEK